MRRDSRMRRGREAWKSVARCYLPLNNNNNNNNNNNKKKKKKTEEED